MMSTAILMSMGVEQSTKRPVAPESENLDGPTFAQTLDARVGISSETAKDPAAGTPSELKSFKAELTGSELSTSRKAQSFEPLGAISAQLEAKDSAAGKDLADVPESTAGAKTKTAVAGTSAIEGESKEIAAERSNPLQTVATAKPLVRTDTGQAAELPVDPEVSAAQTLEVPLPVATTSGTQTGEVRPIENQGEEGAMLMPGLENSSVPKEITATGKTQETSPGKKALKTQERNSAQGVASKNGATVAHPMAEEVKSVQGAVVQASPLTAGQTAGAYVAPVALADIASRTESDQTIIVSNSATASLSGMTFAAGMTTTADGLGRKAPRSAKASVSDDASTPSVPRDTTAAAKSDAKAETLSTAAANPGMESDIRVRTTGETAAATIHALTPGAEVGAGAVGSGVAGVVKSSSDQGAHATGLPGGLREQDGSGVMARSMEPMPRTLSATPTALEVGIPDGTHGWLKVRAEMADGGMVNASVSAASPASQEMLHRELPSLTAYLQSEKVAVNTVVVHPAASAGAESRGYPAGTESGGSGQTPQRSNEGGEQGQSSLKATAEAAEDVAGYQGLHGVGEDGTLPLATYPGGGSWLSVRA